MKRALAAAGVLAGIAILAYALWSGETDEEAIRSRLTDLADAVSVSAESSSNVAVRGIEIKGKFVDLFEKDVTAQIPELGSVRHGRDDLAALATQSSAYFKALDLDFEKVAVTVDGTGRNARVTSQVQLTSVDRSGEPHRDRREVSFKFWKDEDRGWRIAEVRVMDQGEP